MTIIFCAINKETGEVLNRDGSVAGKVVPVEASFDMNYAGATVIDSALIEETPPRSYRVYDAMLAASRVDLSGCEVKK